MNETNSPLVMVWLMMSLPPKAITMATPQAATRCIVGESQLVFLIRRIPRLNSCDAPFSKLGTENRQNVVDIMPTFAPQVILFSKDDLHGAFPPDKIGHVWTIVSNDEQNVARVEEGHLWN